MKHELSVGTARAPQGSIARGAMPVGVRPGGHPIEIPVVVLSGAEDGKIL